MRQTLTTLGILVLSVAFTAGLAVAQSPVGIYGYDTATAPDGGVVRKVKVDPQGRLVTVGGATTDAGVSVTVPYCTVTQSRTTSVGVAAVVVPTTPLAGRWSIRICNSSRNAGTPIVTCTSDGTTPTALVSSNGDVLEIGDCATYTTGSAITCISDTAATYVTSEECK